MLVCNNILRNLVARGKQLKIDFKTNIEEGN
jgi:hypothetical protein